jgi:hypothetical protein
MFLFTHCVGLLSGCNSRVEQLQQSLCDLHILKYLFSGWTRWQTTIVPAILKAEVVGYLKPRSSGTP